jgi:hypothetical protein
LPCQDRLILFAKIKDSPFRENFKVIGGSGGWRTIQTNSFE